MHLDVRSDESSGEFSICSSSCTTASDVIRNIVNLLNTETLEYQLKSTINDRLYLLTVLVSNDIPLRRTGIRTKYDAVFE